MMRAAFSSSDASGSSRFTRRAFMRRPPPLGQPHDLERRRLLVLLGRGRLGACDEVRQLVAQRGELVLADEARERLVRGGLLGAQPRDQRLDPGAVRGRHRLRDLLERGDRDVAVAALPERVGQRLHLAQRGLQLRRGKQGPKISSAARSRRVATRMSWTRSMSSTSSTPRACSTSSPTRTSTIFVAAVA